jgi:hypothetical protein
MASAAIENAKTKHQSGDFIPAVYISTEKHEELQGVMRP